VALANPQQTHLNQIALPGILFDRKSANIFLFIFSEDFLEEDMPMQLLLLVGFRLILDY